jgi:hypothetical protein
MGTLRLTGKALILSTATVLGSAHYDEDITTELDVALSIRTAVDDSILRYLVDAVDVTLALAGFVLQNAAARGFGEDFAGSE